MLGIIIYIHGFASSDLVLYNIYTARSRMARKTWVRSGAAHFSSLTRDEQPRENFRDLESPDGCCCAGARPSPVVLCVCILCTRVDMRTSPFLTRFLCIYYMYITRFFYIQYVSAFFFGSIIRCRVIGFSETPKIIQRGN